MPFHRQPSGAPPVRATAALLVLSILSLLAAPALGAEPSAAEIRAALARDALSLPIGFFLLGLGVAAGALGVARRRAGDPALFYFSGFTCLYALRLLLDAEAVDVLYSPPEPAWQKLLNVLTYLVPLPGLLLFERVIGPGWRRSIHRFLQVGAVIAVIAVPWEIVASTPGVLLGPYRWLALAGILVTVANLFAPDQAGNPDRRLLRGSFLVVGVFVVLENLRALRYVPWWESFESLGILLFIFGLGMAASRRVSASQENLAAIQQELATARRIQASILPESAPRIAGLDVATRYVPAAEVAGDFYDFLPGGGRSTGIVVADVSGHGVPAALVASMLKVAVAAQAAHAESPARVLSEMNQIFHGKLRNQFITAACLYLDLDRRCLTYASAGHPPALLWRRRQGRVEELAEGGLVLGRLRRTAYRESSVPLEPGDRLLVYTDGITEAASPAGEQLGDERLKDLLAAHAEQSAERIAEAVVSRVAEWSGRSGACEDDLTLVVAAVLEPAAGAE